MLRNAFIVFLLGWVSWFWIDKPPPDQQRLPEVSDSLVENFQTAFNILKAGYPEVAFVYIWNAHYLLLSLTGGVLLSVGIGAVSDAMSRHRMRRLTMPTARVARPGPREDAPAQQQPTNSDESSSSG